MPDIYEHIAQVDRATQELLGEILEVRAADPQQRAMLEAYLADVTLPQAAEVLEVGSGTGAVTRYLAGLPIVARATGIDPSPVLVERARALGGPSHLSFCEGDARSLPFPDGTLDLVVFHTVLCHIPEPGTALAEAFRVLRPGGRIAAFDGDYATATVASSEDDPLTMCIDAAIETLVHDRWLVRRLRRLVADAGFDAAPVRGFSFVATDDSPYLLSLIDRGADALVGDGHLDEDTAGSLKAEARRRIRDGVFFGHIAYGCVIGTKPVPA